VEPSAKGGVTSFENLRPRCKACHRAKTARDFPEGTSGYRRRQEALADRARAKAGAKGKASTATRGRASAGVRGRASAGVRGRASERAGSVTSPSRT